MLVSSFDTKYSQTATKYEYLDNNFTNLLSKDRRFSRIFTSVIENQKLDLSSDIVLRSDMTGQVINTILTHDFKSEHFLYYMGDVFKPDLVNKSIKQYRQHGLEIINRPKMESFIEVIKVLDKLLRKILKNDFIYIFTDPKINIKSKFVLNSTVPLNNKIKAYTNAFSKAVKSNYELNLEKNFFSKDYHQDIFFYVYSNKSKKILAQGGGYHYKQNKKKIDGFGFSCNVDNLAEII